MEEAQHSGALLFERELLEVLRAVRQPTLPADLADMRQEYTKKLKK